MQLIMYMRIATALDTNVKIIKGFVTFSTPEFFKNFTLKSFGVNQKLFSSERQTENICIQCNC